MTQDFRKKEKHYDNTTSISTGDSKLPLDFHCNHTLFKKKHTHTQKQQNYVQKRKGESSLHLLDTSNTAVLNRAL